MKFLLKQRLRFEKEKTIYYLFPNQFSRYIVKKANKKDLILDSKLTRNGKYKKVEYYEILENDFKRLFYAFKRRIEKKRSRFYARPFLEQLILVLRYLFKRNNDAKKVESWGASHRAYEDKSRFLRIALNIAKKIDLPKFEGEWIGYPNESFPFDLRHTKSLI